jgi:hypothetical protein
VAERLLDVVCNRRQAICFGGVAVQGAAVWPHAGTGVLLSVSVWCSHPFACSQRMGCVCNARVPKYLCSSALFFPVWLRCLVAMQGVRVTTAQSVPTPSEIILELLQLF